MARTVSFRAVTAERISIPEITEIKLTEVESRLCTLLDECTKYLEAEKGIKTSCRIAGGWLLGSESHDIDIALENIMGYPFAVDFTEFVSNVKELPVKSVTTVKGNPGQSKHLETAKTAVLGQELDFVNLRDEAYAEDSRIPTQVTFGTPLQDALRRDITVNSLFYNVHTRSVEDHCGQGLEDLKNGIVRTPLPPRQTFLDDPLRVIRCIRFTSRFGFQMVPELEASARDAEIQTALAQKITRERVGEEIDKMMGGRDPFRAIQLIDSLSLFSTVFYIPPEISSTLSASPASSSKTIAAGAILHTILHPSAPLFAHPPLHSLLTSQLSASSSIIPRLYLACALTPYRGITYADSKKRARPAVEAAIREGLKIGTKNHYLDGIPALYAAAELLKAPRLDDDRFTSPSERVAIGMLLRETAVHNPLLDAHWTTSLLFALVQDLVPLYNVAADSFDVDGATDIIKTYNDFVMRIEELELDKAVDSKPILDGREVVQLLGLSKGGQWTGRVLTEVVKWQLGHPTASKDACAEWLKAQHAEGKISTQDQPVSVGGKRGKDNSQGVVAKKPKK
ncbi:poly A polymerase C-terminal region-like protein [Auriscalpium vulgare]|uniref:Poly A polymerase C-terminal region-like protein n=1 Tax=Auriscalpium vulgare TaxID=40419 RepID=A0ACB8RUT3_9AGAM|nr:poly A polymerase C-terminal region-like protein [Auriscalpium vulgare]